VRIRAATGGDAAQIAAIYAPYVLETPISFESAPPDAAAMRERIESGGGLYPWFVAVDDGGSLIGYASAGAFRARHAYRFTVETSVYVALGRLRGGVGRALYERLLATLEAQGFTQAIAALTIPNEASVRLHRRLGFTKAGTYREVGYKFGEWRSVALWQRALAIPPPEGPAEPSLLANVAGR
jgi:L-amino acid N-acyltransferase YncA